MQLRRSAVRGEATMSRSSVSPALCLRCSKKPVCAGVLRASLSARRDGPSSTRKAGPKRR